MKLIGGIAEPYLKPSWWSFNDIYIFLRKLFSQKCSIIDVRQGSKYAYVMLHSWMSSKLDFGLSL